MEKFLNDVNALIAESLHHLPWTDAQGDEALAHTFLDESLAFLRGGKRTRSKLTLAGFTLAANAPRYERDYEHVPYLAAAIEVFHASALIHDDLIDHSPTRRGLPASYVTFTDAHKRASLLGNPEEYGYGAAVLLGDYVLSRSYALLEEACIDLKESVQARLRATFHTMSSEVIFGQFADITNEQLPWEEFDRNGEQMALRAMKHKTVSYSLACPLLLGATLGRASHGLDEALASLSHPLGMAFQLRDDEIGIFGDPEVTGKPACGDISEGKRTLLMYLTRSASTEKEKAWLESLVGKDLDEVDVSAVREHIRQCGAWERHEEIIRGYEEAARAAIDGDPFIHYSEPHRALLNEIVEELSGRKA